MSQILLIAHSNSPARNRGPSTSRGNSPAGSREGRGWGGARVVGFSEDVLRKVASNAGEAVWASVSLKTLGGGGEARGAERRFLRRCATEDVAVLGVGFS